MLGCLGEHEVPVQPMSARLERGEAHSYVERNPGPLRKYRHGFDMGPKEIKGRADLGVTAGEMAIQVTERDAGVSLVAVGEGPAAIRTHPERKLVHTSHFPMLSPSSSPNTDRAHRCSGGAHLPSPSRIDRASRRSACGELQVSKGRHENAPLAGSVRVGGESFEVRKRHNALGLRCQSDINRDKCVGLEFGDGEVLRVVDRVPVLLARDLPCCPTRNSVTEQPHLQFGDAFVELKRHVLGEVTVPYGLKKQTQGLGADEAGGDDLIRCADLDAVRDEVYEGGGVDHIAGH